MSPGSTVGSRSRRIALIAAIAVLAVLGAGCSAGPTAPPVTNVTNVCTEAFCLDVPDGWGSEVGDTYIAFHHDLLPDGTFLTANLVDMEAIVTSAGGTWPEPPDEVVRSFWALLEAVDEGELRRTERQVGGAVWSWGSHSTGDMWHVLVPVDGTTAIAVEMRAPNDSWESHVEVVFPTVEAKPGFIAPSP